MKISKAKKPSKDVLTRIHSLKEKKGTIAVIEPETGEYFLGKTLTEAIKKQKRSTPVKFFILFALGILLSTNIKEG